MNKSALEFDPNARHFKSEKENPQKSQQEYHGNIKFEKGEDGKLTEKEVKEHSWSDFAYPVGGGVLSYLIAKNLIDDLHDEKKNESTWSRLVRKSIPYIAGAAGSYGGYLLNKKAQDKSWRDFAGTEMRLQNGEPYYKQSLPENPQPGDKMIGPPRWGDALQWGSLGAGLPIAGYGFLNEPLRKALRWGFNKPDQEAAKAIWDHHVALENFAKENGIYDSELAQWNASKGEIEAKNSAALKNWEAAKKEIEGKNIAALKDWETAKKEIEGKNSAALKEYNAQLAKEEKLKKRFNNYFAEREAYPTGPFSDKQNAKWLREQRDLADAYGINIDSNGSVVGNADELIREARNNRKPLAKPTPADVPAKPTPAATPAKPTPAAVPDRPTPPTLPAEPAEWAKYQGGAMSPERMSTMRDIGYPREVQVGSGVKNRIGKTISGKARDFAFKQNPGGWGKWLRGWRGALATGLPGLAAAAIGYNAGKAPSAEWKRAKELIAEEKAKLQSEQQSAAGQGH